MTRRMALLVGIVVAVSVDLGPPVADGAAPGELLRTFRNPSPTPGWDGFGGPIAPVGESSFFASANIDSQDASWAGIVYKFDRGGTTPVLTIHNPRGSGGAGDRFGLPVATVGGNVAVGAHGTDNYTGAAYLFDGATGRLLLTFDNPNIVNPQGSAFGLVVAPYGNDVLVGALADGTDAPDAGRAYLFDGTIKGPPKATFRNPREASGAGDMFGGSMVQWGDKVIVGAYHDDSDGNDAGIARVFDAASGNYLYAIHNPDPLNSRGFGVSIATIGNQVYIGAIDDTSSGKTGMVYKFDASGNWVPEFHPTVIRSNVFGVSLAGVGDNLLVGDHYLPVDGNSYVGDAYLLSGTTGDVVLGPIYEPAPPEGYAPGERHMFGSAVTASGQDLLIGAAHDLTGPGAVYLIQGVPEPSTLVLLVAGASGLLAYVWRRRKVGDRRAPSVFHSRATSRSRG